jgi:hypothetical protein
MSWSAQSLAPVGSCIGGLLSTFTGFRSSDAVGDHGRAQRVE